MSKGKRHPALLASRIAVRLAAAFSSHCLEIDVVGSLRRNTESVGDIDLVLSPKLSFSGGKDLFGETVARGVSWGGSGLIEIMRDRDLCVLVPSQSLGKEADKSLGGLRVKAVGSPEPKSWENGIIKMECKSSSNSRAPWIGLKVDIYVCHPERFELCRFIRTGSKIHNIKIAKAAQELGMKLHADGRGVSKNGAMVQIESEEQLFDLLEMEFVAPESR